MPFLLTTLESKIIKKVAEAALKLNVEAFVVGGFVRDKLIGRDCKDIDIVCLGDAIELAKAYQELLPSKPHLKVLFAQAQFRT